MSDFTNLQLGTFLIDPTNATDCIVYVRKNAPTQAPVMLFDGGSTYYGRIEFRDGNGVIRGVVKSDSSAAIWLDMRSSSLGIIMSATGGVPIFIFGPDGAIRNASNAVMLNRTTLGAAVVNSSLTSVGTLTSLTVTGNVSVKPAANLLRIDATSELIGIGVGTPAHKLDVAGDTNVTGSYKISGVDVLTGTTLGTSVVNSSLTSVGTLTSLTVSGSITGTLATAAQPNVTSVGTLTSLDVTGTVTAANLAGTLTTAAQPNVTSVGTLTDLTVTGTATAGNVNSTGVYRIGNTDFVASRNTSAVAVGPSAGATSQGTSTVAVGVNAGNASQGGNAVAVGNQAGQNTQSASGVAVGVSAGRYTQGGSAVAIGSNAGSGTTTAGTGQGTNAVAVGASAGQDTQGASSVAVGNAAGRYTQGGSAVAIGSTAGNITQGSNAVAVGNQAGQDTQGASGVAVGVSAGRYTQGVGAVAIGSYAGTGSTTAGTGQGRFAVAFGSFAGNNTQGESTVAVGNSAGQDTQGSNAIAIGIIAGRYTQGSNSVAIGNNAGNSGQSQDAVAIGRNAGKTNQGYGALAFGVEAGETSQGTSAIAFGQLAGQTSQHANSIILNGSGAALNSDGTSRFYVKPVRQDTTVTTLVGYNSTSGEITYGAVPAAPTISSFWLATNTQITTSNVVQNLGSITLAAGTYLLQVYGQASGTGLTRTEISLDPTSTVISNNRKNGYPYDNRFQNVDFQYLQATTVITLASSTTLYLNGRAVSTQLGVNFTCWVANDTGVTATKLG